eukprot:3194574-Alexandrium_andersonii.AAC.2
MPSRTLGSCEGLHEVPDDLPAEPALWQGWVQAGAPPVPLQRTAPPPRGLRLGVRGPHAAHGPWLGPRASPIDRAAWEAASLLAGQRPSLRRQPRRVRLAARSPHPRAQQRVEAHHPLSRRRRGRCEGVAVHAATVLVWAHHWGYSAAVLDLQAAAALPEDPLHVRLPTAARPPAW